MKKRIAYLGLSYPLFYDYQNMACSNQNDRTDSPNPIIESPLGLMILYDELWFLCESVCPNNMRKLPYVKFVDRMFPDLYFKGAEQFIESNREYIDNTDFDFGSWVQKMNLIGFGRLDNHTHSIKLGDYYTYANCAISDNFIFDLYILMALQERVGNEVEFISNSILGSTRKFNDAGKSCETIESIIIPDIPNYLSINGPYHESIEELRSNSYLKDFRRWIIQNHETIQNKEAAEISQEVEHAIQETKNKVFERYISKDIFKFSKSTGKTIVTTGLGCVCTPISIIDAFLNISKNALDLQKVKSDRWQGFVTQAQDLYHR